MDIFVYAVAALLVVSVALYVKAALFSRRPQKVGLLYILLAIPLYMIYYADRWPFGDLPMRDLLKQVNRLQGADTQFVSDPAPAALLALILLVHILVFQRIAVRQRLQRVHDPIANFFAGAASATLVGGTLVSSFHWGWVGALSVAGIFALVYLGALALFAAIVEIIVAIIKLVSVWVMRKVFAFATMITRISSWISSLSGRLGLNSLADRIRADTAEQESIFQGEQESQDRQLYEAYLRDRARRRRLQQKRGAKVEDVPPDGSEPMTGDLTPQPTPATTPAAPTSTTTTGPAAAVTTAAMPTVSVLAEESETTV